MRNIFSELGFTATDLWMANKPYYMNKMEKQRRDALIRFERGHRPESCCECLFYYTKFDNNLRTAGGGCTIKETLDIPDMMERSTQCPL